MNNYSIAMFLHVVGALGFFVALGLEWTSLRHLRRAMTTDQVREWLRVPAEMGRVGMISMLTLLAAGFYMMAIAWGAVAWIMVTLGAIVVMILAMVLTRRRMMAIGRTVSTERGPLSPALSQLLHDPMLTISIQTRVAIALGIVFLMTVKPGLGGSLLTIAVAIVLGLASSLPMPRRAQVQEGRGD
jgi:hypothetical protein